MARRSANKRQPFRTPNPRTLAHAHLKLFVSRLPDDAVSEDVAPIFRPHGNMISCDVLRGSGGSSLDCAFVVYGSIEEALRAIDAVHGRVTLSAEKGPLRVRFAQGEAARHGIPEDQQPGGEGIRVFVGNIPSTMKVRDLAELFSTYGELDDAEIYKRIGNLFLAGFVVFCRKVDAHRAIKHLNEKFRPLRSVNPLEVRFAKRNVPSAEVEVEHEGTQTEPLEVLGLPALPPIDLTFELPLGRDDPHYFDEALDEYATNLSNVRPVDQNTLRPDFLFDDQQAFDLTSPVRPAIPPPPPPPPGPPPQPREGHLLRHLEFIQSQTGWSAETAMQYLRNPNDPHGHRG